MCGGLGSYLLNWISSPNKSPDSTLPHKKKHNKFDPATPEATAVATAFAEGPIASRLGLEGPSGSSPAWGAASQVVASKLVIDILYKTYDGREPTFKYHELTYICTHPVASNVAHCTESQIFPPLNRDDQA